MAEATTKEILVEDAKKTIQEQAKVVFDNGLSVGEVSRWIIAAHIEWQEELEETK